MYDTLKPRLQDEIATIKSAGLYKEERVITTPQGAVITTNDGKEGIKFLCK